jgi:tetratricopeptide (TPR) repeat protein
MTYAAHVLSAQLKSAEPRRFEELVTALLKELHADATRVGANDNGVDVWVPSKRWGLQCKRYSGSISWAKCEQSLHTARQNYQMDRYTFVFPTDLSGSQQRAFDERLGSRSVNHWGVTELRNLLALHPEWERLLDGPSAVHLEANVRRPKPSRWFAGREPELAILDRRLIDEPVAVVHGLSGVGKTDFAAAWCERHTNRVVHTWWLDGRDGEAIRAGTRRIGRDLGVDEAALRGDDVVAAVGEALCGLAVPWLLVLDDVSQPVDVEQLVRDPHQGRVLVTSLYPHWGSLRIEASELLPLKDDPAAELLAARSGRSLDADIRALAVEDLGGLPLALIQVGAYLEQRAVLTTQTYRKAFSDRAAEMLARSDERLEPRAVATVWSLSVDEATQREPHARKLLEVVAYLAPDQIPLEIFSGGSAQQLSDAAVLADAVAALHDFSLLSVDPQGKDVSVHRLVQVTTRASLTSSAAEKRAAVAAQLVLDSLPARMNEHEGVPAMRPLVDHVLSAADHAADHVRTRLLSAQLLSSAANFARITGSFRVAKELFGRSVDVADASPANAEDRELLRARFLDNYASICCETGDYARAVPPREQALRIREEVLGPDDPLTIKVVGNLAGLLSDVGRPADALPLALRAWERRQHAPPVDRAWGALDLAGILVAVGKSEDALEFADEAVAIFAGPEAGSRGNLAWALELRAEILLAHARLEDADRDAHQALQIRQTVGEAHVDVARAWLACALVGKARNEPARAYTEAQKVLELTATHLDDLHPNRTRSREIIEWATDPSGESLTT